MNRKIKFRAWDKEEKKMTMNVIIHSPTFSDDKKLGYIYMQYTGLRDKNGKEIYEGDIVKSKFGVFPREPSVITWHLGSFCFKGTERDKLYYNQKDYDEGINSNSFEVIGNIYENPKLLK